MRLLKTSTVSLAILCIAAATGCGADVPDRWAKMVPTENLTIAFGDETSGAVKKIALNYEKDGLSGEKLRGLFTARIEKEGFTQVSECVAENGTSSAIYVNGSKEVVQVAINLLGDVAYDVGLDRVDGLPGVSLAGDTCKWLPGADKFCEDTSGDACKLK